MDNTCANCKWWDKELPNVPSIPQKGERDNWGTCKLGKGGGIWPATGYITAYACDYDGYKAWLLTEESHYCNQHQPNNGQL